MENKSQAQRDWRLFGSSYIAALMEGQYAWLRPIDVYQALRGELPQIKGIDSNHPIYWGHALESAIVDSWMKDHGVKDLYRNETINHPSIARFCTTPDGIFVSENYSLALEVKNVDSRKAPEWAEGVPSQVYAQCMWHLMVLNAHCEQYGFAPLDAIAVRALIGGNQKVDYEVGYSPDAATAMITIALDFIENHADKGIPPAIDASQSYTRFLARVYPGAPDLSENKPMIQFDQLKDETKSLIADYLILRQTMKELEGREDLVKNILRAEIGDNYGLFCETGKFINPQVAGSVSWKKVFDSLLMELKRAGVDQLGSQSLDNFIQKLQKENTGESYRKLTYYERKK